MLIERTVHADVPVATAFAYLADFEHTEEWDGGTVRTERVSGDGGVGTRYHNTSRFLGRETELVYTLLERVENQRLHLRGVNKTVTADDTMTFTAEGPSRTSVTYRAEFAFHGVARFLAPLLRPALTKLGDEAEDGLRRAFDRLARETP